VLAAFYTKVDAISLERAGVCVTVQSQCHSTSVQDEEQKELSDCHDSGMNAF
jgi:hypothetical protein